MRERLAPAGAATLALPGLAPAPGMYLWDLRLDGKAIDSGKVAVAR